MDMMGDRMGVGGFDMQSMISKCSTELQFLHQCLIFVFNMQGSHPGTDIKLVLLNGFLVMHAHKASFASNLNFCFPLVTHFGASVFML